MHCGSCFLPLAFGLMLLSGLQFELAEQLKVKVLLNSMEDGDLSASIHLGNATRNLQKNISLLFDIDAIMDESEKLIGAKGLVRETEGSSSVEFSTVDEISNDEEIESYKKEIQRLRSTFCPGKGEEMSGIISRAEWGAEKHGGWQTRPKEADLLIVNGHTFRNANYDYYAKFRSLESYYMGYFGDVWFDFWITDEGQVFEGIGWDHFNHVLNGGLGPNSLMIAFMKKGNKDASPSEEAIKSFRELVKKAICAKKLAPNYSTIPYYLIHDLNFLSNNSFERNGMREWEGYRDNLDFLIPSKGEETLPIVSRVEWGGTKPEKGLMTFPSAIEYLVVRYHHGRCFINCNDTMKVVEKMLNSTYGDMASNFLVAEDGRAYEAEGWENTLSEDYHKKNAAVVGFLGKFTSFGPNKNIFTAFNSVIEEGLRLGKLSQDFKIVSIKAMYPKSTSITEILEENIRNLYKDRFSENF